MVNFSIVNRMRGLVYGGLKNEHIFVKSFFFFLVVVRWEGWSQEKKTIEGVGGREQGS